MRDKDGRELTYLRVSLIDRCNLRCFYCMPKGDADAAPAAALLSLEEIEAAVALFAELGITKVRLTGGEPLLRRGVPGLVRRLKALPGIRQVVMTTNAVLLGEFAAELKGAGLDRLNVSLDSLDRETFRRITGKDALSQVLSGLDAAAAVGLGPIKLNAVLMKGYNEGEILDLVRFAVAGKMEMRFIEWMPTLDEIRSIRESRFLTVDEAKRVVETVYRLVPDASNPHAPARTFFLEGTDAKVGFISPLSNAFCGSCNRLRLKATGQMKTCLHGKEDLDLRALLRAGTDREEVKRRIEETVFARPKEHFLNERTVAHNDFAMVGVGG